MTDPNAEPETPAAPDPGPSKAHGDAFLDQSGSRHGEPPEETPDEQDQDGGDGA